MNSVNTRTRPEHKLTLSNSAVRTGLSSILPSCLFHSLFLFFFLALVRFIGLSSNGKIKLILLSRTEFQTDFHSLSRCIVRQVSPSNGKMTIKSSKLSSLEFHEALVESMQH